MPLAAIDRILNATPIEVQAFAICDIGADAAVLAPPRDTIEVHHVLAGTLYLTVCDRLHVLHAGAMVLVPPGHAQVLAASMTPARHFDVHAVVAERADGMLLAAAGSEGRAPGARLICGRVQTNANGLFGPLDAMAQAIVADLVGEPLASAAFGGLLAEVERPGPFSRSLAGALMKVCLALALRKHVVDGNAAETPALFAKPWLARAVSAVLDAPDHAHSVQSLARAAGRSRSAFARDFTTIVGMPPMEFVAAVRLDRGRRLLETSDLPVGKIAGAVGFGSRSHFSRVFRTAFGKDPSTWRLDHIGT